MAMDNNTTITGNAGGEPELRFTPGGQAVCSFGVAVSRRWYNKKTDDWDEETSWIDVTAWGDLAENAADSIGKGDRVTVTGRLNQRSWEDKDTGANRSKVEVVADDVALSLRWATATAERTQRPGDDEDEKPQRSKRSSGNSRKPARQSKRAKEYSEDEEPF